MALREKDLLKLYADLTERGWTFTDSFLSETVLLGLLERCKELEAQGAFVEAGIGKGIEHKRREDIRGDKICWIENLHASPIESDVLGTFFDLMTPLGRSMRVSFNAFECHYAVYEAGRFYRKHVDVFQNDDARFLSVVLYLNPDWQPAAGGQLRIYNERCPQQVDAEIEPVFGRLVLFLSRRIYHQVLATRGPRRSLTGWFKSTSVQRNPLELLL